LNPILHVVQCLPLPRAGNDPNIVKDRALENAALYGL